MVFRFYGFSQERHHNLEIDQCITHLRNSRSWQSPDRRTIRGIEMCPEIHVQSRVHKGAAWFSRGYLDIVISIDAPMRAPTAIPGIQGRTVSIHAPRRGAIHQRAEALRQTKVRPTYCSFTFHNTCLIIPNQVSTSLAGRPNRRTSRRTFNSVDCDVRSLTYPDRASTSSS